MSKCWCYGNGIEQTLDHSFLTTLIALKLWRHFVAYVGFSVDVQRLVPTIFQWWAFANGLRGKKALKAIPTIILWELWKYRNNIKH